MHDGIKFVLFPAMLLCTVNMKIEFLVTYPLSIVCIYFNYQSAFTTEGGNMDCYQNAELTASNLFEETLSLFAIFIFAIHDLRKTQITHFIAIERA